MQQPSKRFFIISEIVVALATSTIPCTVIYCWQGQKAFDSAVHDLIPSAWLLWFFIGGAAAYTGLRWFLNTFLLRRDSTIRWLSRLAYVLDAIGSSMLSVLRAVLGLTIFLIFVETFFKTKGDSHGAVHWVLFAILVLAECGTIAWLNHRIASAWRPLAL